MAVFAVTGCQSLTTTVEPVSAAPTKKLVRGASVFIAIPHDASYRGRQYRGSGSDVASAFQTALSGYVDSVILGECSESTADVIATAKQKKCVYAIIPEIKQWEDHATYYSGLERGTFMLLFPVRE